MTPRALPGQVYRIGQPALRGGVEPFVGRQREVTLIRGLADEVRSTGVGRLVLIGGEPGIGRSRLCAELSGAMTADGFAVAWSRCWADGPGRWPWPDVVDELGRAVGAGPVAGIGDGVDAGDRFGCFRGVVDGLRRATVEVAAVALLDDLHLAGAEAMALTQFVVRSLHRMPLLVVATHRIEGPGGGRLAGLARDATDIRLAPLTGDDLADYLGALGSWPTPVGRDRVDELLVVTGGNPRYLTDLARSAPSPGSPDDGLLDDGLADDGLSAGLRQVATRRVEALDDRRRTVLGAASILGAWRP